MSHLIALPGKVTLRMAEGADPHIAVREAYGMTSANRPIVSFSYGRNGIVNVSADTNVRAMSDRLAEAIREGVDYHMTPSTV